MIFNRGKTKDSGLIGQTRAVETETLNRWRNAAVQKPGGESELEPSSYNDQNVTVIDVPPPGSTITLTSS